MRFSERNFKQDGKGSLILLLPFLRASKRKIQGRYVPDPEHSIPELLRQISFQGLYKVPSQKNICKENTATLIKGNNKINDPLPSCLKFRSLKRIASPQQRNAPYRISRRPR